jgi:hypothetical protein
MPSLIVSIVLLISLIQSDSPVKVSLSNDQVLIHLSEGQTGSVQSEIPLRFLILSSVAPWSIHYQATPLKGPSGELGPEQLLILTPYTNRFDTLDVPRLIARGEKVAHSPVEVSNIRIGFFSRGDERPGVYEGQLFSPDGGPTIFVKVIIEPLILSRGEAIIKLKPEKGAVSISFKPDRIQFPVTGRPGEYDADNPIHLTVEGKNRFVIKVQATPLKGPDGFIPPERIFVNPGNGHYYSLDKPVVVLRTKGGPKKGEFFADLLFRIKTTWQDRAGLYEGELIITFEPDIEEPHIF